MARSREHIGNLEVWLNLLERRLVLFLRCRFINRNTSALSFFSAKMEHDAFAQLLFSDKNTLAQIISHSSFEKHIVRSKAESAALKELLDYVFEEMRKQPHILANQLLDKEKSSVLSQQTLNLGSICQDLLAGNSIELARILQNSAMLLILMSGDNSLTMYKTAINPNPKTTELMLMKMQVQAHEYLVQHPELRKTENIYNISCKVS